jgi:hypothetical protein
MCFSTHTHTLDGGEQNHETHGPTRTISWVVRVGYNNWYQNKETHH